MFELIASLGLYILPAYSADHLNNYETLSAYLRSQGLNKLLHRTAIAAVE